MEVVKKEVYSQDKDKLQPHKTYVRLKLAIDSYVKGITKKIATDITVQNNVFKQAEKLVDAIGIKIDTPGKFEGYALKKDG
jgi:hypothetical protein